MRDDLHRLTQELALPFAGDDIIIYASGGDVIGLRGPDIQKALIMTQIEVRFRPVVGDEALTVFVGVEGTGVYINVGVELLDGHRKTP